MMTAPIMEASKILGFNLHDETFWVKRKTTQCKNTIVNAHAKEIQFKVFIFFQTFNWERKEIGGK